MLLQKGTDVFVECMPEILRGAASGTLAKIFVFQTAHGRKFSFQALKNFLQIDFRGGFGQLVASTSATNCVQYAQGAQISDDLLQIALRNIFFVRYLA